MTRNSLSMQPSTAPAFEPRFRERAMRMDRAVPVSLVFWRDVWLGLTLAVSITRILDAS